LKEPYPPSNAWEDPDNWFGHAVPHPRGLMVTVECPPGSLDPIHRHNAHGFIYVLEGSIVTQVSCGKEVTVTPGQTRRGRGERAVNVLFEYGYLLSHRQFQSSEVGRDTQPNETNPS
jgi:Cupin domain